MRMGQRWRKTNKLRGKAEELYRCEDNGSEKKLNHNTQAKEREQYSVSNQGVKMPTKQKMKLTMHLQKENHLF